MTVEGGKDQGVCVQGYSLVVRIEYNKNKHLEKLPWKRFKLIHLFFMDKEKEKIQIILNFF